MAHLGSLANRQAQFSLLVMMVHATWVSLDELLLCFCYLTPIHSRGSPKCIYQCAPGNVLHNLHKWRSRIRHVYRHPLLLRQCRGHSRHSNWLAIHPNPLQFDPIKSRRDSYDVDSHRHVHFCHVWFPRFSFEAGMGLRPR
jgi:hypothetical protein